MIEVLPVRLLTEEDASIFGPLAVSLGELQRAGLAVGLRIVVTPPNLTLKTTLEHYSFHSKEVFEQALTLVKKELNSTPVPKVLISEAGKHKKFLLQSKEISGVKNLWLELLGLWIDQIRTRLWSGGFYPGVTDNLDPQVVVFINKLKAYGNASFDPLQDDVVINTKSGKVEPEDLKKIVGIVQIANKKLFIPHEYEWVLDGGVKLAGVKPYTPPVIPANVPTISGSRSIGAGIHLDDKKQCSIKIFYDLSGGLSFEKDSDGVYIASEKIFDLNNPRDSFDNLVLRLVESALAFDKSPVFLKLADQQEGLPGYRVGMGKVRGALRLLHQKSLLTPLMEALDFARHKKSLHNVHIVIPFVRSVNEFLQIKRELAIKKLMRKNSLQIWMEVALPENIINLESYLEAGLDGVILNLDELVAYLNGFDPMEGELAFYKNEVEGLIKFMDSGIEILHKSKIPFIAFGALTLQPKVLEFLVEKGVYGIVVERYEAHSVKDLLYQAEKRMVLRRS